MCAASSDRWPAAGNRSFATTQWSVVLAAGDLRREAAQSALAQLCETYWYPLYAYVRRRVDNVDDAQERTQAFFCHLLEKHSLAHADRNRGRFRTFLLAALDNFLVNQWKHEHAEKRGGGAPLLSLDFVAGESLYHVEPTHDLTPEKLFQRRWVLTVLGEVLKRLHAELTKAGKADQFEQLKDLLVGAATDADYQRAAAALAISPAAAKQAVYRLRKRYRQLFREEVARTVDDPADVDDEIARLLETLGR